MHAGTSDTQISLSPDKAVTWHEQEITQKVGSIPTTKEGPRSNRKDLNQTYSTGFTQARPRRANTISMRTRGPSECTDAPRRRLCHRGLRCCLGPSRPPAATRARGARTGTAAVLLPSPGDPVACCAKSRRARLCNGFIANAVTGSTWCTQCVQTFPQRRLRHVHAKRRLAPPDGAPKRPTTPLAVLLASTDRSGVLTRRTLPGEM